MKIVEINEIIGALPGRLTSFGMSIISLIFVLLLIFTGIIRIPETTIVPFEVKSIHQPVKVLVRDQGIIEIANFSNGDTISTNDVLFVYRTNANYDDILIWNEYLDKIDFPSFKNWDIKEQPPLHLRLGELQINYLSFCQLYKSYLSHLDNYQFDNRLSILKQQMEHNNFVISYTDSIIQLGVVRKQSLDMNLNRQTELYNDGVISKQDLETEIQKYNLELSRILSDHLTKDKAIYDKNDIQLRMAKIDLDRSRLIRDKLARLSQTISSCIIDLERWKRKNIIKIPQDGIIYFPKVIQKGFNVSTGEHICTVLPANYADSLFIIAQINEVYFDKIRQGQNATLSFNAYKNNVYGQIGATITHKSIIPFYDERNYPYYQIQLRINEPINTKNNSVVHIIPDMTGRLKLFMDRKTILSQLFKH